jgi:hypothetical protein
MVPKQQKIRVLKCREPDAATSAGSHYLLFTCRKECTYTRHMPGAVSAPESQLRRRDKFRAYMQAFNPTAPAREAIEAGFVLEDLHQSLYRNLAARADLEPGSQQLLVGGVGSGKTTELLLARRWLIEQGHTQPLYIDVSKLTDLAGLNTGALVAGLGLGISGHLAKSLGDYSADTELKRELGKASEKLRDYAYGETVWVRQDTSSPEPPDMDDLDDEEVRYTAQRIPGRLRPPLPSLEREIQDVREPLAAFLAYVRKTRNDVVAIFDSLDRLLDAAKFWSVVHQDLRLLRELKVSVLATAPLSVLFGSRVGQSISDLFDRVQHLSVIPSDPENDSLRSVLEKRRASELLSAQEADAICHYSGGVLRDLISLARDAAEEAYVSDRDSISAADVEKVVQQLGTGYLRGLGPAPLNMLLQLESTKTFQLSLPVNVELLLTRRVLEYSSTDFRVHPALLSVIPRPETKRA